MSVVYKSVTLPDFGAAGLKPQIPVSVYEQRISLAYQRGGCDWLVIYGDREHLGNIIYLTGFDPRWEEAFFLVGPSGQRFLLCGNECIPYAALSPVNGVEILLAQSLSLMGQDRSVHPRLSDRFRDAGLRQGDSVGLVGWKYLEPEEISDTEQPAGFYMPDVYVRMLRSVLGKTGSLVDRTAIMMHPETGLRADIDADQIAEFEWAATRSSLAIWRVVSGARVGDTEYQAVQRMAYDGTPLVAHVSAASTGADVPMVPLRSPSGRVMSRGDGIRASAGFWGGLCARAGLLDHSNDDYLRSAKVYFSAILAWYENAQVGAEGASLYDAVTSTLASGGLRSLLNPGHLTGHEEWVHSPVRPGSLERLRSGMPFQVDIIPAPMRAGWAMNCEDAVVIADDALQLQLKEKHPACHARIEARRQFMRNEIGVLLHDTVVPISSTPSYFPPFWLEPCKVLTAD